MMSLEMVCATREAYVAEQAEKKAKEESGSGGKQQSSGNAMFDAMLQRAGVKNG